MDNQLKKMRLKVLNNITDTSKDELFKVMLEDAKHIALNTLFPFDLEQEELPERIENVWVVRCAIELYNQIGQEGYISYSENGLSWTKDSSLVSYKLMSELTPKVGVPK